MLDTKIDFTHSEQYTLTLRLDTDGFAFAVSDPSADKAAPACEDWAVDESVSLAANLKRAFAEKDWLARPFRRVNVLMATRRFTLMPLELFEDEQAAEVFYYNHPRWRNEEVRYNILHNNNLVVLFGIDQSVSGFLRELCRKEPLGQHAQDVCTRAPRVHGRFLLRARPLLVGQFLCVQPGWRPTLCVAGCMGQPWIRPREGRAAAVRAGVCPG